jgi:hypothetical protein
VNRKLGDVVSYRLIKCAIVLYIDARPNPFASVHYIFVGDIRQQARRGTADITWPRLRLYDDSLHGRPFGSLEVPTILQKPKRAREEHQGRKNPERNIKYARYVNTGSLIVGISVHCLISARSRWIQNALTIAFMGPSVSKCYVLSPSVSMLLFRPERSLINLYSTH